MKNVSIIAYLCVLCCSSYAELDCYIMNVGQANYVILKEKDRNALIVDCGCPNSESAFGKISNVILGDWTSGKNFLLLSNLLKGVNTWVIITHQHTDHYVLLPTLVKAGANLKNILIGGQKKEKKGDGEEKKKKKMENDYPTNLIEILRKKEFEAVSCYYLANNDEDSKEKLKEFENIFGKENGVAFLLPNKWPSATEVHDQNIIVKINYKNIKLLFPGDASGMLLDQIVTDNPDCLDDIDVMLLSHHGSNEKGELSFPLLALRKLINKKGFVLTIISSDPKGEHALPWNMLEHLNYWNDSDCYECLSHEISVRGRLLKETTNGKKIFDVKISKTMDPIFVTCNSKKGYYKITVSNEGEVALRDGNDENPQFFFKKEPIT